MAIFSLETYLFFCFLFFSHSLILKRGSHIVIPNKGLYKYLLQDLFLKYTKKTKLRQHFIKICKIQKLLLLKNTALKTCFSLPCASLMVFLLGCSGSMWFRLARSHQAVDQSQWVCSQHFSQNRDGLPLGKWPRQMAL